MDPTLPGSELLLIGSHYLYLKVVLETQEKFVHLEELCPVHLAWAVQELVTDNDPSLKLFLQRNTEGNYTPSLCKCLTILRYASSSTQRYSFALQ